MEEEIVSNQNATAIDNLADVTTDSIANLKNFWSVVKDFLTGKNIYSIALSVVVIVFLWILFKAIKSAIKKIPETKLSAQHSAVILKFTKYTFYIIVVLYVLSIFGIKLSALLGAAGIAGVAIGFAAQTSMSNLISGLFVLSENVVRIGDVITVEDVTGVVDSIDALSVKVHTFDNQLVRIPNSKIIDSNMINTSYFGYRRLLVNVSIDSNTDLQLALDAIMQVPALCPCVIKEPEPFAFLDGFSDGKAILSLAVYFNQETGIIKTKNEVYIALKKVFDEKGISIPKNQLEVSTRTCE